MSAEQNHGEYEQDLLEEMAYGEASTPEQKLMALAKLRELNGGQVSAAGASLMADIEAMDDDDLDKALLGYFHPGHIRQPTPVQPTEEQIKRSARRTIKEWVKGHRPDLDPEDDRRDTAPVPGDTEKGPQSPTEPRADEYEPVDPMSLVTKEEIRQLGYPSASEVGASRLRIRRLREESARMAVVDARREMPPAARSPDNREVDPASWQRWSDAQDAWPDD